MPVGGSATRRSLPSTGSARPLFAGFHGTMEHSDSPASVPSRFVSFAWRLPSLAPVFVAPFKPDAGLGPGVFGTGNPAADQWL
jgi:hypothetical protein